MAYLAYIERAWRLLLILYPLAMTCNILGGFERHLRPVDKGLEKDHSFNNIDFIYMINLDERPEKLAKSLEQLAPYGICPCRFSAVNGWKLPLETINDIGLKFKNGMQGGLWGRTFISYNGVILPKQELMHDSGKTYFAHYLSLGAIGCALSHLSILKDALDSGYQTIWVMEDDIHVQQDPRIIPELIRRLDASVGEDGWDILFTDVDFINAEGQYVPCTGFESRPNFFPHRADNVAIKKHISPDFTKIEARFGAHSMIVRRSGMEKILNFIGNYSVFLPFDVDYTMPPDIKLFSLRYDVVSQLPNALSDNLTTQQSN